MRTASRNLAVAAVVVLVAIGAAAAFAVGFSGALEESLANPASAPALRIGALERLREVLGYDGFLKTYRALPITNDAAGERELARIVGDANAAVATLKSAGENDNDWTEAKAIASLVAVFDRAARDRSAGAAAPDPAALEQTYATLKPRLSEALDAARYHRIETLAHALAMSQTLAILAMSALSLTLFGLAWFVRTRLLHPLRALRQSTEDAADGGMFRHLWGIERRDEIGALARAVNRLRRQAATNAEDDPNSPAGEMRAVLENRSYHLPAIAGDDVEGAAQRIDADLAAILATVADAKSRIEDASRDAARASQTAIEAANLSRTGAEHFNARAEHAIAEAGVQMRELLAALTASVSRLSRAAARLETAPVESAAPAEDQPSIPGRARALLARLQPDAGGDEETGESKINSDLYEALARLADAGDQAERDCEAPLAGLATDLEALETLTRRGGISEGDAASMTAALIEAIDRLNGVVERVATATEKQPIGARR